MAIICSDDFTGSNASSINGRTLNNALGGSASKTWIDTGGNPMHLDANTALPGGNAAFGLVSDSVADGKVRIKFHWTGSSPYQAIVYAKASNIRTGSGIAGWVASATSLRIVELTDSGNRYGTDRATKTISALSTGTDYVLELKTEGSVATATVYQSDGTTVIDSVSHDFTSTSFTNTHWGFSNFDGQPCTLDNFVLESIDAPPSGGGLLLQLMQHGQFSGGLL